jgi:CRISPR-associated endoribonuclease Cas6
MLAAVVLEIVSKRNVSLPMNLGRANHAAILQQIGRFDPALSRRIHDSDTVKPLTCSSVLDAPMRSDGLWVEGGRPYRLRFTGLQADVSGALLRCLVEAPPETWVIDEHLFRVVRVIADGSDDGWSGLTTCAALVERYLDDPGLAARRLTLEFASPTAFKSDGVTVPLPQPDLVFGSLGNRWQAFSDEPARLAIRQFAAKHIGVSWFDLHSHSMDHKNQALRVGAVGRVAYAILQDDYLLTANLLADFALYAGVGVQTAAGMGQCRRLATR